MELTPLLEVRHRIKFGAALQFNIRNTDGTLLLASGQVVRDEEQLESLYERGAVVDACDAKDTHAHIRDAAIGELPELWRICVGGVGRTLKESAHANFLAALEKASRPVLALIQRDTDLAIFQMVQQEAVAKSSYGISHSIHAAVASYLVAGRLGWDASQAQRAFKAALTMNIGMIELQGRLANQITPLTPLQREAIREHPKRSVEILEASGITDRDWLDAVGQHHEAPDGSGYPGGRREVACLAQLLHHADVYTAMLSARAYRGAMPPNKAARMIYMRHQNDPMVMGIVKEFGLYPPGCYVMLASGETGVVVKRGANANTPVVAALVNRHGEAMMEPVRRNTALAEHAIIDVIHEKNVRVRVSTEKLVGVAHG